MKLFEKKLFPFHMWALISRINSILYAVICSMSENQNVMDLISIVTVLVYNP